MERMSPLDAMFLHVEDGVNHMHIASCAIMEGPPPDYDDFVELVRSKLPRIPRYRQTVRFVPGGARPAGVGRRPALPPRLPRPPHRPAAARFGATTCAT